MFLMTVLGTVPTPTQDGLLNKSLWPRRQPVTSHQERARRRRPSDRQCQVKPRPQHSVMVTGWKGSVAQASTPLLGGWPQGIRTDGQQGTTRQDRQVPGRREDERQQGEEKDIHDIADLIDSCATRRQCRPWCLLLTPGLAQSLASQEKEPHESGLGRRAGRRARRWGRRRDGRTLTCRHCRASRGIDRSWRVPGPGACGIRG